MIHLGSICVVGLENHNLVLSQLFDFQEEQSSTLLLSSFFDAVGFVLWVKEDFFIQIMDWHVRNEADVDMTCQFAFPSNVKSYTYKGYSKWPLVYDPWWLLNSNYLTIMGWCWDNHLICKEKKKSWSMLTSMVLDLLEVQSPTPQHWRGVLIHLSKWRFLCWFLSGLSYPCNSTTSTI